ncbi:MAG: nitroreductase family protein [Bacilli bacterium]|nr:nitroreductase family protein [Bacilli bacterium]
MEKLYPMLFKRKSFHIFKDISSISNTEIKSIKEKYHSLHPLIEGIKTEIKIVKKEETTCNRQEEYCILFYSEKKSNYLINIGYLGEQLDLFLSSLNIGGLWYGIGKPLDLVYNDLDFVIMIAIAKVPVEAFRKDMFKSKRKRLNEIWVGSKYCEIGNIVRFAPSACNTQPWIVEETDNELNVYRYKKPGKRGIMPLQKVSYYNKIDMGIFLCFLEICLEEKGISYNKEIFNDEEDFEKTLIALYKLNI